MLSSGAYRHHKSEQEVPGIGLKVHEVRSYGPDFLICIVPLVFFLSMV